MGILRADRPTVPPGVIQVVFGRVLKAAKLPEHFTPHCLRHSFASRLLSDGGAPRTASVGALLDRPDGGPLRPDASDAPDAAKGPMRTALRYFELGASATRPHMTDADFAAVGNDPALDQCPQIKEVLTAAQRMSPKTFASGDVAGTVASP